MKKENKWIEIEQKTTQFRNLRRQKKLLKKKGKKKRKWNPKIKNMIHTNIKLIVN